MIYEEFIQKSCNKTGSLGYTKAQLRSLCNDYDILRYNTMTKVTTVV